MARVVRSFRRDTRKVGGGAAGKDAAMRVAISAMCYVLAMLALVASSCARNSKDAAVCHVVVCWLRDHGNEAQRNKLIEQSRELQKIPGVISVRAGAMLPSARPIVDTTFDVAIIMTFPDEETMGRYLEHPDHKKAVKEVLTPLTSRVVVYDFVGR
jgi:hypothetical protein